MVKIKSNPLKIDFVKCIIEDKLLQLKSKVSEDTPDLLKVWTIDIDPRESKYVIELIRNKLQPDDPISFLHIKRIKKLKDKKLLTVILCSEELYENVEDIEALLEMYKDKFSYDNLQCEVSVPRNPPPTREIMLSWSELYWPLNWNGNPNDQILNDYKIDMEMITKMLNIISKKSNELDSGNDRLPIVTAFVNPTNPEDYILSIDERDSTGNILDHSIMSGIQKIAKSERSNRLKNMTQESDELTYLCLNFDVYTTHEPCSMCSMALVHSRIKRCIFINQMNKTGCLKLHSGDSYCMQDNKLLNSKYEVFQWLGDDYKIPKIDDRICC
ncbi:hypothetical protein Kpol_1025p33 [Vanderwaltozyma polyspora DSM 70294]|uniref:CMP/dCMP-type deaminase domain-containing protein n=1 Tax=Vanderwaltozyma polyspora (strain ATCC 22028 / DSM 70294 / BCRC 21397 / CBS 2163 / NBRC 10782 / NRRL Y-8283 / UCD 57-17) TaxID=436907 RepID=A7TKV8_VANPO|nr:uncharacterized protein Kpol_1025p33 [Vanderwaltozyma polyspora DSM 70294]EDO17113.1 hypothetical protein Kpol_1025p33 [Vanderwaltozyma polyspora DSM 70294]